MFSVSLRTYLGEKLQVIAWIWSRSVRSPNPVFSNAEVPLVSTFILSGKKGKETYVDPVVEGDKYTFKVKVGVPPESAKNGTVSRKGAICLFSNAPIDFKYLRSEAKAGRFGRRLMAVVAEGVKGRIYLSPSATHENYAESIEAERFAETPICHWPGRTNVVEYGMTKFLGRRCKNSQLSPPLAH